MAGRGTCEAIAAVDLHPDDKAVNLDVGAGVDAGSGNFPAAGGARQGGPCRAARPPDVRLPPPQGSSKQGDQDEETSLDARSRAGGRRIVPAPRPRPLCAGPVQGSQMLTSLASGGPTELQELAASAGGGPYPLVRIELFRHEDIISEP